MTNNFTGIHQLSHKYPAIKRPDTNQYLSLESYPLLYRMVQCGRTTIQHPLRFVQPHDRWVLKGFPLLENSAIEDLADVPMLNRTSIQGYNIDMLSKIDHYIFISS